MKKFISLLEILTALNGTDSGEALYNNKSGELCGFVCNENNVFTEVQEAKEMITDFLKDTDTPINGSLAEVYGETGAFRGFTYNQ